VVVIDARGMLCPWPALKLGRAIREAAGVAGATILVQADDPRAPGELRAVATAQGWSDIPSEMAHEYRFVAPDRTNR
jgi:tRNA 2-thiouridine synthesizing protein A